MIETNVGVTARSKLSLLIFCLLFSGVSFCKTKNVIILFGDSITAGSPYTSGNIGGKRIGPVQEHLQTLLKESGRDAVVLNFGWSGTTTRDAVHRLKDTLIAAKKLEPADYYYLAAMYGTNDSGVGISARETQSNVELIIDAARRENVTPIIGTITPKKRTNIWPVRPYNRSIFHAAKNKGALLVDHNAKWLRGGFNLLSKDGLHPNKYGYELIAYTWFNLAFESLIEPSEKPDTNYLTIVLSLLMN
ncbi:SGNH/GDSL hydrolase family protein [Arenicella xantha]|uniref:Lysophospholipase L1-like esterase n=1 Tax=Arenicella xantha TaxID=644221 RepID=A0A395JVC5_9GAMM|nr:SGNH/GDSL hydrolase family protein [Arenicella xantha]RBP53518.1 lysophospholipase L1-like esterase [Arenicella xantha]